MSEAYTYNGIGVILVVEAVFSDGVAIYVADRLDVGGPRIDGVEVMQRATDEGIRRSHAVVLYWNPSPHSPTSLSKPKKNSKLNHH